MDLAALKAELLGNHPVTGPYDADSSTAADELNTWNLTRPRTEVTGSEVLNAIDKAEFLALTDAQRERVWNILHLGTLDPFGLEADLMIDVFGAGSATITGLQDVRQEPTTRAFVLGLGVVDAGDVERARAG
jgi:hypothetical protein